MSYGLLKGAFRPPDEVCVLRSYVRQRSRQDAARCIQHMQKALNEMNVHLDTVLSDIMGKTSQHILRAIVNGERDGAVLAEYRDRRVKADVQTIARSLRGNWRDEHAFALTQALARYDFFKCRSGAVTSASRPPLKRYSTRRLCASRCSPPPVAFANARYRRRCGAPWALT